MKEIYLFLFVVLYTVSNGTAEHEMDHTENPSISLDYDTVTQIIEALSPDNEPEEQTTEVVLEVTPLTNTIADYVYDKQPVETFQKRKSPMHQTRRQRRKKIVISSHVIDLPEDEDVGAEPHYFPDEPVDPEDEIPQAPCEEADETSYETDESSVERAEESYGFVGSLKGTPGIDYPNYKEIPLTSFTCADKKIIPGFYADVETRCQVFHVCYPHRRESFLCPVGTTFNQPIKACDYWYNGNCSASASYFDEGSLEDSLPEEVEDVLEIVEEVFPDEETVHYPEPEHVTMPPVEPKVSEKPVVIEIPVEIPQPIIPKPIVVPVVPKPVIKPIPVPKTVIIPKPVFVPSPVKIVTMKKFLPVKAKVVQFAAHVAAPVKAKVLAKAPIKIAKALPIIKVLKTVPVKKAVAKKVLLKTAIKPLVAKKILAKAVKAKAAKVLVKKAAISALTKKHLALSLLRMAKGHKAALHGMHRRPVYYI